jgi:hypothetical protein
MTLAFSAGMISHKLRFEEGTNFRALGKTTVPIQFAYSGNVAMMFILTYTSMLKNKDIGGQYFFAGDDTVCSFFKTKLM